MASNFTSQLFTSTCRFLQVMGVNSRCNGKVAGERASVSIKGKKECHGNSVKQILTVQKEFGKLEVEIRRRQ